jgi:replicative DNA helicase
MSDFKTTYDHDLEEVILGAILMDKDSIYQVQDFITPDCFHNLDNRLIYKCCIELSTSGEPIDIMTVWEKVKAYKGDRVITPSYISELTMRVAGSSNIEKHGRILSQLYIKRQMNTIGINLSRQSRDTATDALELVGQTITKVSDLIEKNAKSREATSTELFNELNEELKRVNAIKHGDVTGVRTGLTKLDKITGGWQNGHTFIIAGRPGAGKTAFTKACINGAISQGRAACMFSLEMTKTQLVGRIISEQSGVDSYKFTKGGFNQTDYEKTSEAMKRFYNDKGEELLIIDDTASLSITELQARAKRIDRKYNPAIYIVDYLQLMSGNKHSKNRVLEIGEISRGLKLLAKDLNKPFLILSQLSRGVESRDNKKPILSDLRESGDIEQDADGVMFIYRPHYYFVQGHEQFGEVEIDGVIRSSEGIAQLIIAKNRHGALDTVTCGFTDKLTKFHDLEDNQPDPISYNPNRNIEPSKEFDNAPF